MQTISGIFTASRGPKRRTPSSLWRLLTVIALLVNLLPVAPFTQTALATAADFKTTDFAAAAPFTYNHATGGGAYNDRTVGDHNDITEQLEGAQFSCGDIVTYLAQIEMEAAVDEANQSIRLSFSFLANSTGQAGAAHSEVVGVSINYGQVENGDDGTGANPGVGFFGLDSGISDDGGSTATLISTGLTGPLFESGSELLLTVDVDDLEAGESVVLRIDTRIACNPGSNPTGNLQGKLEEAIALPSNEAAGSGAQTIPFLRVGDIAGAGEPLLQIQKTVTAETGTCGVDDVEVLDIFQGDTVKYCYVISNPGTADLFDVEVIDDNGTPGNTSDDITVTLNGLTDIDGQGDLGDLASGGAATGEALVTQTVGPQVVNIAEATGNNGRSGGNFAELTDSDTATVNVDAPPNSPPVANDDSTTTPEDTAVTINATGNDTDPDGNLDPTTATVLSGPANGTLVNNGDGTFTYTPDANFHGTDTFTYQVCDTNELCDTATVTITVTTVNDGPVANDDSYSTPEDTTLTIAAPGILGNDSDVDGDSLTVNLLTQPSHGTLTQNADGSFIYTPDADFNGVDSYTYEACDPSGACDTATVTITVTGANDAPVAEDDAYATDEETSLTVAAPGILGNDSDPDGDALTVNLLTEPSHGTLIQNADGSFIYTPDADFNGVDSYTYEACDPSGTCDTATVTITVNGVNDAPVAVDDSYSTSEDTPLTVPGPGILDNDSDIDGDTLTVNLLTSTSNGTLTQNVDGSFSYVPNANFNSVDSYTYEACDPSGLCDTATVTINVAPVNDPPVAVDDSATTDEDVAVTIPVLSNDSDIDGDPLTVNSVTDPAHGSAVINPDGTITYTPDPEFSGTDTFTYEVCDPSGACDTATVTITVNPVNDAPVAADDSYSTSEDTPLTVPAPGILSNDSDIDGDALTVNMLSTTSNGTLTQTADGSFEYTPNADFNGTDSYTYEACDPSGLCDTATVTINVTPVNDPPVAGDDSATTDEDAPVTISVLGNDSDLDGDNLTVKSVTDPAHGTAVINPDGTITYTPDPEFSGTDTFTYEVCDPSGACDTATVTITVNAVNDAPVAADDSYSTSEDTPLTVPAPGILSNDSDIDGDALTVNMLSTTSNGTLTQTADGSFEYTPNANFNGTDSYTYEACDPSGLCDSATVTINVTPVNDPPVANDDSATTDEDAAVTIPVLGNDSDPDGDSLTVKSVTDPAHGSAVINPDGTITYTPDPEFSGSDTFTYEVCDPSGACDTATVTVTVNPVNDAPVAADDSYSTAEDTTLTVPGPGILSNDSDIDGDALTVNMLTTTSHGTLTQNADGSFTYVPNADFNGVDSYTYEACDPSGLCDSATVTINVTPVNDPPVANNDSKTTPEDTPVLINAAGNDTDIDGNLVPASATLTSGPSHGMVTNNGDGTFTYVPDPNYNGPDSFEYQICDSSGACDTATVTIDVTPVNDPPVANDDSKTTPEDESVTVNVLGNDSDVDGNLDPTSVSVVDAQDPSHGKVTVDPLTGEITYTPDPNFNGSDTFTYQVCDSDGLCDTATVNITVTPVNDAPVAVDDAYSMDEDTTLTVPASGVLDNDADIDGDVLTVNLLTTTSNGTLTQNTDGSFSYIPNSDFNGMDSYTYEACDPSGLCDAANVTIVVNPVNDRPVALDDSYVTAQNTSLTIDDPLLGVMNQGTPDYDIDGDALSVSIYDEISAFGGAVSVNPDGTFSYTPAQDFAGYDTFTYTISDGNGGFATATVTIEVTAKNGRSISVSWGDWWLRDDNQNQLSAFGAFNITNQSGGYDVQLQSFEIIVQYRTNGPGKKEWIDVAVEGCSFSPVTPTILGDTLTVDFSGCELQAEIPADSTVRVTAVVEIYGHKDKGQQKQFFLARSSKPLSEAIVIVDDEITFRSGSVRPPRAGALVEDATQSELSGLPRAATLDERVTLVCQLLPYMKAQRTEQQDPILDLVEMILCTQ